MSSIADTTHESAEEWWEELGAAAGYHSHPVCRWRDLKKFSDETLVDRLMQGETGSRRDLEDTRQDIEYLVEYARRGREAAEELEGLWEATVACFEKGDVVGALEALRAARRVEDEYGDWPSTRDLAERLGFDLDDV